MPTFGACGEEIDRAIGSLTMFETVARVIVLAFTLVAPSAATVAQTREAGQPQMQPGGEYPSPDGTLAARVLPIGEPGREWSESRIEIRARGGRLLRSVSFASSDKEHGQGVEYAAWTPDSKFFVFNTSSSGGHMPWRGPAYFYARGLNRFRSLDDYIGPGPCLAFSVAAPDIVRINTYEPITDASRDYDTYRPVRVRLGGLRISDHEPRAETNGCTGRGATQARR
jgi:hypothetical protein